MAKNNLTLPAAGSTQGPQTERVTIGNEERGATGGTTLSITSCLLSMSTGLASIDLTQKMLDQESRKCDGAKSSWPILAPYKH